MYSTIFPDEREAFKWGIHFIRTESVRTFYLICFFSYGLIDKPTLESLVKEVLFFYPVIVKPLTNSGVVL